MPISVLDDTKQVGKPLHQPVAAASAWAAAARACAALRAAAAGTTVATGHPMSTMTVTLSATQVS
jgi:hypothetical protein